MILWPAISAFLLWRSGNDPWAATAAAAVIVASVPAFAVWMGASWAKLIAEYVCMGGMACALVYILLHSVTIELAPAAAYFVLYAFLSHDRIRRSKAEKVAATAPPASKPAANPQEHPMEWLRENVEAIAVAFVMALVIRCFCIEVFQIPSSSMEKTLMGNKDGKSGDRIMVSKFYYALDTVSRYDVVVFKFPLNPTRNFIKRVVGLPGEDLFVYRGDIYATPSGGRDIARLQRKPLRIQRALWQPVNETDVLKTFDTWKSLFSSAEDLKNFEVQNGVLANNDWKTPTRFIAERIADSNNNAVCDIAFDADVVLVEGAGSLYIDIKHDYGIFRCELKTSDACTLSHNGKAQPLKTGKLTPGRSYRVEFMVYDGAALVLIDGRVQGEIVFHEHFEDDKSLDNGLSFGSKDLKYELRGIKVGRDLYYRRETQGDHHDDLLPDRPLSIPSDSYVMMGDNVNNSHDSRAWIRYTFELKDGRVIECESQEYKSQDEAKLKYMARNPGKGAPGTVIGADIHGHDQAFNDSDLRPNQPTTAHAPFVKGHYIIGKAFWIWWPPNRWFRLIR